MPDANTLDRIDIRYAVTAAVSYGTPKGDAEIIAKFLITLGTYAGTTTRAIMAANINERGIHDGDVDSVACAGGAPSIADATAYLAKRGIQPDDIREMIIDAVVVDETDIATSYFA